MTQFQDMMRRARRAAQTGDWAPQPGTHKAVVDDTDVREQRATGTPIVALTLELAAGPDRGKQWEHPLWFSSDAAAERSAEALAIYGIPGDVWDACESDDDLARALDEHVHGRQVEVTVKPKDDGNGVWTNVQSSHAQTRMSVPADTNGLGDGAAGDFEPAGAPDDDVPF